MNRQLWWNKVFRSSWKKLSTLCLNTFTENGTNNRNDYVSFIEYRTRNTDAGQSCLYLFVVCKNNGGNLVRSHFNEEESYLCLKHVTPAIRSEMQKVQLQE